MHRHLIAVTLLVACSGSKDPLDTSPTATGSTPPTETETPDTEDTEDTEIERVEGEDTTVTVFDAEYVYFGAENRREVDVTVELPDDSATYSSITGRFALTCPESGLCDHWDRYGSLAVILNAGTKEEQRIEIDRFITAYRVGFDWEADLTPIRPLLTGTVTFRVYIDTWVGPGHTEGEGWLFYADLDYAGGPPPSPEPIAVIPAWGHQSWSSGLDENPVEAQVIPQTLEVPADATSFTFRSFITGHGWNNSQNCAEFCSKWHYYTVGGDQFGRAVWRDDCASTVTDGTQLGTWTYDRAGWCPGAQVYPWDTDVTDSVTGGTVDVSYQLEPYTWAGDGDQPYYYMSGVLIAYR
jgi:hypothetical protein